MAVGMFGVGIVFIYLMPVLLTPLSLALLLMLLGLLCFVSKGFRLWGVWFALGLLWGWWTVSEQLSDRISSDIEGVDLVITGVVDDLVRHSKKRHLFTFTVLSSEAAPLPKRLRLSWYYPKKQLEAGEVWQLKVRLKQPNGFNNPGGFDYEGWLWTQGVGATGYVRAGDENQRLPENHWRSWYPQQRGGLYAQLAVATQNLPHAGFIRALAMGDKSSLMPEQKQVLQATGTSHLLAISGLHVGMVSMLVFLLVKWLWS
ncbi:MAG: DUF4131 domain-containing protein, partial [Methylococcales bacterium]|nr:DUF4131 domain-containing protein [Methylococcales bacterium]